VRTTVLDPDSPTDVAHWKALLEDVAHDVYHLPEYLAFAARRQIPGIPRLFVAEEGSQHVLLPLILRGIPAQLGGPAAGWCDATSPRGYPGPIVSRGADNGSRRSFIERAIEALREALRERGVVAAYVRMHPLFPLPSEALLPRGGLGDHGEAIYVDLSAADDEWFREIRENHRRDIKRARQQGYTARVDAGWERFGDFVGMYEASMERLGAAGHWRLGTAYFTELREALGDALHLWVVERDGEAAAGALLTEVDGLVEYHLAGTADDHVRASPSKLLIDHARSWAKGRGNRLLHLAGSLQRGDSLSNFKRGFSQLEAPVHSWRFVADPDAYVDLLSRWQRQTGMMADGMDGFFPAYRKPSPAEQ
jgi:CelD/BcsL family acetyltransferase involved in cellulose biosynthesis